MKKKEGANMYRKNVIYIALAVLVVVVVGVSVLLAAQSNKPRPANQAAKPTANVEITDDGFVPATLRVAPGTTVVWTNKTAAPHHVASDPYPDRSLLSSLDSRTALGADEAYSYTFDKTGTWTYHDHLTPTMSGTVIVE